LRPKLARLLKQQQAKPDIDPEETIANFYFVLSHLTTEFYKQSPAVQRQMMSKLVKRVMVNNLSPHLYYLYIIWQDGVATRPDVALLWRCMPLPDSVGWSEEDKAIVRAHWPKGQQREVMKLLPVRTWTSIKRLANAMGVHRLRAFTGGTQKVNPYHETMTYKDLETAMQFAQADSFQDETALLFYGSLEAATQYNEEEGNAYICEIVNELAATTRRGKLSAYWPWSVEVVGFSSFTKDEGESSNMAIFVKRTPSQAGEAATA